jgi:pyruvate dehydrogenase E1 component beta subunit
MAERQITYGEAIREAIDQSMQQSPEVFIIGEGVPDSNRIFGTTKGLLEKYGAQRVQDMPVSENAMTGICIGAAIQGLRPILVHQRVDFSLLALDQVINNAAKWHYMFGGEAKVPIVIRMIIGMGWGQGAQHSQSLQALYSHIPGLKVVMPSTPYDAKGLMMAAVQDNNPVIYLEHRWLHNIKGYVPEEPYSVPIGEANVLLPGKDITLAATSYMNVEAMKAAHLLKKIGISVEIVDLRTLKPLDDKTIIDSVRKTGRLIAIDSGYYSGGFAGEIIARVSEKAFKNLQASPARITLPDIPTPSTQGLTRYYYPTFREIARKIMQMLKRKDEDLTIPEEKSEVPCDVPDKDFTGPF